MLVCGNYILSVFLFSDLVRRADGRISSLERGEGDFEVKKGDDVCAQEETKHL